MKEAFAYPGPKVDVVESPIPTAGPFQMIVKVACVGLNPKDWKVADGAVPGVTYSNEGDDFSGVVHTVGQGVTEFKVGDRVGVFHKTLSPGGGWAEYAIAWESMAFHLADHVSLILLNRGCDCSTGSHYLLFGPISSSSTPLPLGSL